MPQWQSSKGDREHARTHARTWKQPRWRHARAMSWMASARVAGSLSASRPRLITGNARAGGAEAARCRCCCCCWWRLAMFLAESEKHLETAGMPRRRQDHTHAALIDSLSISLTVGQCSRGGVPGAVFIASAARIAISSSREHAGSRSTGTP